MPDIIAEIKADFRKALEDYNSPETPAKKLVEDIKQNFLDRKLTIGENPIPTFIHPYFMTRERMEYVRQRQNAMMSVIEKLSLLYFTEPETRPMFLLDEWETKLAEIERGWRRIVWITRNDAFMGDDFLKFIEFNCDSPGGPMYSDVQCVLVEETPVIQKIREKWVLSKDVFIPQVLNCLITAYRGFGGSKEKPNIAIIGGRESATLPEFKAIVEWFKDKGYNAAYTDARDVTYDGKFCYAGDMPIDVGYRRGWIKDFSDHYDEITPLLEGYRKGALCIVNPPHSVIASNKSLMVHMHDPKFQERLFTEEEKTAIRENLPWTQLLEKKSVTGIDGDDVTDMWEYARKNRNRLVLKPFNQYGGKDVSIGPFASESEWDGFLQKATENLFILQEYADIPEEILPDLDPELKWVPKKINQNFFAYNGIHAGGMVRTSEDAVINISKGGGLTPILIVEGKK